MLKIDNQAPSLRIQTPKLLRGPKSMQAILVTRLVWVTVEKVNSEILSLTRSAAMN